MNWRYETWRKLYVREEGSFAALGYQARVLADQLLKYVDAKGVICARRGEGITEAICFRLRADRGSRRQIRKALQDLLDDGYLVRVPGVGPEAVRIKNFVRAQGRDIDVEEAGASTGPIELSEGAPTMATPEPASTVPPSSTDQTPTEHRTDIEAAPTEHRPSTEGCVKSSESLSSGSDVPSVPFRSIPDVPSEGGGETPPPLPAAPRRYPIRNLAISPQRILDTFGRIRSEVSPNTFPWTAAGQSLYEKARQLAEQIQDDPGAQADVEQTMRLSLERARDSQDARDKKISWVFSVWVGDFTDLREEIHGMRAAARAEGDKDCELHAGGRNTGKLPLKHRVQPTCPECRHLAIRAGPRPASRPQSMAEILSGGSTTAGR